MVKAFNYTRGGFQKDSGLIELKKVPLLSAIVPLNIELTVLTWNSILNPWNCWESGIKNGGSRPSKSFFFQDFDLQF